MKTPPIDTPAMATMDSARPLFQARQELATLLYQINRRQSDREIIRTAGKVYYGIDNDTLTLISAPWRNGGGAALSELFANNGDGREAFGFLFAEFVFRRLSISPFIIVPPSENELDGIWNAVFVSALEEFKEIDSSLRFMVEERLNDLDDREAYELVRRVLVAVHGVGGPVAELRRINRLMQLGAVRRADSVLDENGKSPFANLGANNASEVASLRKVWLNLLNQTRPQKREGSNEVDSAVLARVQYENQEFARRGEKAKLCLVTADSHIRRAATQVKDSLGRHFDEQYLRSPVCFLADLDFFRVSGVTDPLPNFGAPAESVTGRGSFDLADWIAQLLNIKTNRKGDRSGRERLASELISAREQWTKYLLSASAKIQISKEQLAALVDAQTKAPTYLDDMEVRSSFDVLRQRISTLAIEAAQSFAAAAALSRFWGMNPNDASTSGRGIPLVRFPFFPKAADLSLRLAAANGLRDTRLQFNRSWMGELLEEDPSGYTILVVISMAFASFGEWQTALTVSTIAHSLAQREIDFRPDSLVFGDEAAYLSAVFARLSAKEISDLELAEGWIEEWGRLAASRPRHLDRGEEDPRLVAERLALRLTTTLMSRYSVATAASGLSLLQAGSLEYLAREHYHALSNFPDDTPEPFHSYVRTQFTVNLVQIELLRGACDTLPDDSRRQIVVLLEDFFGTSCDGALIDHIEELGNDAKSSLVPFVFLGGALVFLPHRFGRSSSEGGLVKMRAYGKLVHLMPYDAKKVAEIERYVESAV